MKKVSIKIIKKADPCTLLDLSVVVDSKIFNFIQQQDFVKICTGKINSSTENFLQSYIWVVIKDENIKKLEECLTEYINNAR